MRETLYDVIGNIFDPGVNPFFTTSHNGVLDDNIEDAIIIEEES